MSTPVNPGHDDQIVDPPARDTTIWAKESTAEPTQGLPPVVDQWSSANDSQTADRQPVQAAPVAIDRSSVMARQKERFGGMKVGSGFFGWLTATGMAVLLIALLTAAGVAFGIASNQNVTVDQAVADAQNATGTAQTVGLIGGIALLLVLFVAYYCGGYVAGRMARFNGIKQGLSVWLWGVVTAVIIAALAAIAGSKYDVLAQLNLPRIPVNEGQVTTVGLIAIGAAILAALLGAMLGGLAGMRFHRKVDAAGMDALEEDQSYRSTRQV